jgi:hypothetical protein
MVVDMPDISSASFERAARQIMLQFDLASTARDAA